MTEHPPGTILGPDGRPADIPVVDPPKEIGFKVYEERGGPIYRIPACVRDEEITLDNLDSLRTRENMITTQDGLQDGQRVLLETLVGWSIATIQGNGAYSGESMWHMLEWREDYGWYRDGEERIACWTCTGSANMKALKRLTLFRGTDKDGEGFPTVEIEGIEETSE